MIYWYDHVDFLLSSVSVTDYINWFFKVEQVLHTWNKSCLVVVYSSFPHCCIWFSDILLWTFCIYVHEAFRSLFSFLQYVCLFLTHLVILSRKIHAGESLIACSRNLIVFFVINNVSDFSHLHNLLLMVYVNQEYCQTLKIPL